MNSELGEFAMWLAVGGFWITVVAGPIGRAIGRRIAGGKSEPATGLSTGEMTAERVAALEDRIAELEAERHEMAERLEFAERMLTKGALEARASGSGSES